MLYEIYKLLQEAESRINGNVTVSIRTKPRIIVLLAVWQEGFVLTEQLDILDVMSNGGIGEKEYINVFVIKCNKGYEEKIRQDLERNKIK